MNARTNFTTEAARPVSATRALCCLAAGLVFSVAAGSAIAGDRKTIHHDGPVQPDLIFIAAARRSIIEEKAVFGAPDLIVEVQSPSTASRDRGMKKDLYARIGVPHYWLVDPRRHTLLALRLAAASYGVEAEVGARGAFKPALFPGLTLRSRDVFAR